MKNIKHNKDHLHAFTIKYLKDDGTVEEGTFTTKRLSIMDRSKIGVRTIQLSNGLHTVRDDEGNPTGVGLDEETAALNSMIAHLEVCLIQKPHWFDLTEITDFGLLQEVYAKVSDFELTFFRSKDGQNGENGNLSIGEGNSGPEHSQSNTGGTITKVVGKEVQASLDP